MKAEGMSAEAVCDWLAEMQASNRARFDAEAARQLGISARTMNNMKNIGADYRTALACAALLEGLEPYL